MNAEDMWFSEPQGVEGPVPFPLADLNDREFIRAHWDKVEQGIRAYLVKLTDEQLFEKPITFEEDKDLVQWQVLLHVINLGTDHRAQLFRIHHDLGVNTKSQDYIFYVYDDM